MIASDKTPPFAGPILTAGNITGTKIGTQIESERENIDDRELRDFKRLARDFGRAKSADIERMLSLKELVEICHGSDSLQK